MIKIWLITWVFVLILSPIPAIALQFDPNYIISDFDLEDASTMTEEKIQSFLLLRGSALAFYTEKIDGKQKTASQIIYESAKKYSINPQFLITMLQKEQSLVEDANPSQDQLDWAMGFGICDSCSKSDPSLQELKGFATQVTATAEKIRVNYLRDLQEKGYTLSGWGPGIKKFTVDGIEVTPVNKATAVLYTYNPYQGNTEVNGRSIGANFNFWKIWQRFFARLYPDGTLAQSIKNSIIYLIQDGKKRPFKSMSTFLASYAPNQIVKVDDADLEKYETGPQIKFAQYSLLRSPKGNVFLLSDDKLRPIESREVFRTLGFNPEEINSVSEEDLKEFETGESITLKTAYPQGALAQNRKTGGVFYIKDGIKHAIVDKTIMRANFPSKKIIKLRPIELTKYETGGPVLLKDGLIVKSGKSPEVYFVSASQLRPIVSEEAFLSLGYNFENVKEVSENAIALHMRGEVLDIIQKDYEISN